MFSSINGQQLINVVKFQFIKFAKSDRSTLFPFRLNQTSQRWTLQNPTRLSRSSPARVLEKTGTK